MTIKYHLVVKILFFVLIIIALMCNFKLLLILILLQILWRRFYKVRLPTPEMELKIHKGQIFAPVHGVIREIITRPDNYYIKVQVGLFSHKALYAMGNSEVDSLETYEHAQKTFASRSLKKLLARPKYKKMHISFTNGEQHYSMSIINTTLSLNPAAFIMPGDRVRFGAHFGWMPLGGIIVLDLPSSGKLLVKAHDKIKMFNTLLMETN